MKVMACVKRVIDFNVRIQVKPDGTGVVTDGVKMGMNPFDEIAVEEAVRLREKGIATEIIAVSIGGVACQEQLRTALAMGANRAIHIQTDDEVQPLTAARLLNVLARKERPGLILLGKQAIDDDSNQTGQMLAALWGRPQATFASKLEVTAERAIVTREIDAGLETLEVQLPAVVTVDLRLNQPRYIKLPDIMKAKRVTIEALTPQALEVNVEKSLKILKVSPPPKRAAGKKVADVKQLVDELKARGVLA